MRWSRNSAGQKVAQLEEKILRYLQLLLCVGGACIPSIAHMEGCFISNGVYMDQNCHPTGKTYALGAGGRLNVGDGSCSRIGGSRNGHACKDVGCAIVAEVQSTFLKEFVRFPIITDTRILVALDLENGAEEADQ